MASQAQIDANKRNAQRSTGPKSETGRSRAALNALKDGSHARTVRRVLPQENPVELNDRIDRWIIDLKPRNDAERELVKNAANLSWEIDRARRIETARLANRVLKAQVKTNERRMNEVGELGRRLLYNVGAKTLPTSGRPWEDNPAAFLKGLEKSAEGCRWLLDHWLGLRVLLDRDSQWTYSDMFRLIRLLGKYPVEAINDPKLNAIFLAWDAMVPGWAERFWKQCKECKPPQDPGFSDFGKWREITDRLPDAAAAIKFFETLIDEQLARLEELLAVHEEIAGDEAAELADRASFDASAGGERLRRSQTARSRELRQTLELLMKMQRGENHGQTDGDDGTMKDDKCAETETTTGAGRAGGNACKNEGECAENETDRQAGSAARRASGTRPRDRHRTRAALEMMVSERLDEQGFEKFFADPPAALVVIKGLQKLAELKALKALPGRAPVQAHRAVEKAATSENGVKNVEIEANGDETQLQKPQTNRTQNTDADGEKRSQTRDEDSLSHG